MGAVKKIEGTITKTLNGHERTFALNMRALCTLEDELFENVRVQRKLDNALLKENNLLKAQVEDLKSQLVDAGIEYKDRAIVPTLFLGLLDLNNMSNAEAASLVFACLTTHHPELTKADLIDEMGTLEQSRAYLEAVLEAVVISQGGTSTTTSQEASVAPEKKEKGKG